MSVTATRPGAARQEPSAAALFDWLPLREFFLLDVRSLALFRVCLGFMVLLDWVDRLPHLYALYSDQGILPREIIAGLHPISIHMLHGSVWFQAVLAAIAIAFSLLLIVGYRTPFVTLVSWFLLISVHTRNPTVLQGGDQLFRMMLFWGIFLPLGASYSVDAARDDSTAPRDALGPASVAYILQLCLVYWFASVWKWDGAWRDEATAVYLAVQVDYFTTRFGYLLLQFPEVLRLLTRGTMLLETIGPVLLFLPFHVGLQRLVLIAVFILFHAGLALSLELGNFPFLCMVAWLPLLPGSFWDRLQAQLRSAEVAGLTIYHDADRPRGGTRTAWLRTFLLLWEARVAPAQESPERLARLRKHGGWGVVDHRGKEHFGGDALTELFGLSRLFFPVAWLFRTRGGAVVAGWLAARIAGPVRPARPAPARPAWRPPGGLIGNTVVVFCLAYVVLMNVWMFLDGRHKRMRPGEPYTGWLSLPWQVGQFGSVLGLEQGWGLFAPGPGRTGGWYVIAGVREDGTRIDLMRGGQPATEEEPPMPSTGYPSNRWRKMMMNLPAGQMFPYLLPGFTRFMYEDWNRRHPGADRVKSVEVIWMLRPTMPPGEERPPPQRLLLGTYSAPVEPVGGAAGWVLVVGTRPDGEKIDLLRNSTPIADEAEKPDPRTVTMSPWSSTLLLLVASEARADVLPGYTRYLFNQWNKHQPPERQLVSLEVVQRRDQEPRRTVLARYSPRDAKK